MVLRSEQNHEHSLHVSVDPTAAYHAVSAQQTFAMVRFITTFYMLLIGL